jgi:murein L,D-transpeptidase YafK
MSRWRPPGLVACLALVLALAPASTHADEARAAAAAQRVRPSLERELSRAGLRFGAPVLLRVFKHEHELELWVDDGARYRRFRTWPICTFSGALGPKLRKGDGQAPEGFYTVGRAQLNPGSAFHLSFDLGYPNAYDRARGRTGSALMVHGNCVSIGCYAMGDDNIEQIYTLVDAALRGGQRRVPVHAFPFRFDAPPQRDWRNGEWGAFWQELEPAYRALEETGVPPRIRVVGGHYRIAAPGVPAPR